MLLCYILCNMLYYMLYYSKNLRKRTCFIRTLRVKFNIFNDVNKNPHRAENGRDSYIGFISSESLRIFKNSRHSGQNPSVAERILNKDSNLKRFLQNPQKATRSLVLKRIIKYQCVPGIYRI